MHTLLVALATLTLGDETRDPSLIPIPIEPDAGVENVVGGNLSFDSPIAKQKSYGNCGGSGEGPRESLAHNGIHVR